MTTDHLLRTGPRSLTSGALAQGIIRSLRKADSFGVPFRHWLLRKMLGESAMHALHALPFAPVALGGVSGKRELHNDQRTYVDAPAIARHPVCAALAEAFQSRPVAGLLASLTGAVLEATFLRIEFAQDTDGFFLEPHTDLGVKALTLLCFLPLSHAQLGLGTDIYAGPDPALHVKRVPFAPGAGLLFVPAANTWHGFAKRPIAGVRRSLVINYVTAAWRAREQLAFPEQPVRL